MSILEQGYHYDIAYVTHPGNIRQNNQDSLLIRRGTVDGRPLLLLAVADGMGGLAHGEWASERAVQHLNDWWERQLPTLLAGGVDMERFSSSLSVLIEQINWNILQEKQETSGTTLTMALIYGRSYLLLQVGDSRAYLIKKDHLEQLTQDQTWCAQQILAGNLTPEQAKEHPMRHVLISSLGVATGFSLERRQGKLHHGDGLLLVSDGFYNEMDETLLTQVGKGRKLQGDLEQVAQKILQGIAADNLTAVLLRLERGRK